MSSVSHSWIFLACLSACFIACRQVCIKRFCSSIAPDVLVFWTRFIGMIALLPLLYRGHHEIHTPLTFFGILCITVTITAVGGILQIRILQRNPVSTCIPYQSLTPLFMVPCAALLLRQVPPALSLWGLVLACAGAFILNYQAGSTGRATFKAFTNNKTAHIMIGVALAFGLTTVLDRIAIGAGDALLYSFFFSVVSSGLMLAIIARKSWRTTLLAGCTWSVIIQGLLWIAGFYAQMAAVAAAVSVSSGVTYVKMLTLFSVLLTVVGGGALFSERKLLRASLASILMIAGSILALWHR